MIVKHVFSDDEAHQLMSKTSRFTGKLGSRIGDRGSGVEDRLKKLEIF